MERSQNVTDKDPSSYNTNSDDAVTMFSAQMYNTLFRLLMDTNIVTARQQDAVEVRVFLKDSERDVIKKACTKNGTNMSHLARTLLLEWAKGINND